MQRLPGGGLCVDLHFTRPDRSRERGLNRIS